MGWSFRSANAIAGFSVVALALLVPWALFSGLGNATQVGSGRLPSPLSVDVSGGPAGILPLPSLSDGGTLRISLAGGSTAILTDRVSPVASNDTSRVYRIDVRSTLTSLTSYIRLSTHILTEFASVPGNPGGPDNLPPLVNWSWTITKIGGSDVTAQWSVLPNGVLSEVAPVESQSYIVSGFSAPRVQIEVGGTPLSASVPTSIGAVSGPTSALFGGLGESPLVRGLQLHTLEIPPSVWDLNTSWSGAAPIFHLGGLTRWLTTARELGATPLMVLPVGTWGGGNSLPPGMPLDLTVAVRSASNVTGYFPTPAAYAAYVDGFINRTVAAGWSLQYWLVGVNVPVGNSTGVATFTTLFNVAQAAIHSALPPARVGFDGSLDRKSFSYFLNASEGVGFLSFHVFPSRSGPCANGPYCAPNGQDRYLTDAQLMAPSPDITSRGLVAPLTAQALWQQYRHESVPLLISGANLAAFSAQRPDVRVPGVFGAAWLGHLLIEATASNVSSVNYLELTSLERTTNSTPFGGFGYGLFERATGSPALIPLAPAWTVALWNRYIATSPSVLPLTVSAPGLVDAVAVPTAGGANVFFVNKVATATTVTISLPGLAVPAATVVWVDGTTFVEQFSPAGGGMQIVADGTGTVEVPAGMPIQISLHGYGAAAVAASATSGPMPLDVQLSASSTTAQAPALVEFGALASGGVAPYSYSWAFGDGTPAAFGAAAPHSYTNPGTYVATVTVSDGAGLSLSRSILVTVLPGAGATGGLPPPTQSLGTTISGRNLYGPALALSALAIAAGTIIGLAILKRRPQGPTNTTRPMRSVPPHVAWAAAPWEESPSPPWLPGVAAWDESPTPPSPDWVEHDADSRFR